MIRTLILRPDRMVRAYVSAHGDGWLIRWVYADSIAFIVDTCPGGDPTASLMLWN